MFSATWPEAIDQLAREYISSPTVVTIGTTYLSANPNVAQRIVPCEEDDRLGILEVCRFMPMVD